jgi:probable F420-dependent oxidoreductase
MRLGVGFPHPDIDTDPVVVRDFAQAAENAGFDHLSVIDHVAGADAERFVGIETGFASPPYLFDDRLHEPLTMFSYLAGLTSRIELVTSVLVLPQRETVLVAKQAAEVSLLSGGRLRLGVGVGWNHAEYEALGADFHTRGQRIAEQIVVLRKLWTDPLVTFEGRWHKLDRVGIAPLPTQPIPIWMGGGPGEVTLRRIASLADGWMPSSLLEGDAAEPIGRLRCYLDEAGREPSSLGIQATVGTSGKPSEWVTAARRWELLGATDLRISGGDRGSCMTAMQGLERAIEVKRVLELELDY